MPTPPAASSAVSFEADHGAGRLFAVTIHSYNASSTVALYVHAKVAIVDDRWLEAFLT